VPSSPPIRPPRPHDLTELRAYFASVSEVVMQIEIATELATVIEWLREGIRRIGAEVGTFLSCIHDDEYKTCRFLLACDLAWFHEYEKRAWSKDDPWLEYCRRHAEPTLASDIPVRTAAQADIVRLAARFGFHWAVVVPAPVGGGLSRLGMLCVGSADPDRFDNDRVLAVKVAALPLAASLNRWCTARAREELLQSAHLSPEDLLLLDLQRQGLSTKQMADITGKSTKSINSRFQRINAKLSVPTRKAAARRAAEYGLI
jgi:DNA-binding CsgD family transcriptional regulator